jgi:hypothetical protein
METRSSPVTLMPVQELRPWEVRQPLEWHLEHHSALL